MTSDIKETVVIIALDWPAPARVKAAITTRQGSTSEAPYDAFNLALHVGDNKQTVNLNRDLLKATLNLDTAPAWLQQNHTNIVVDASVYTYATDDGNNDRSGDADASYSTEMGKACIVLTADCLPILVCNKQGTWVQAIHAGWKGLANRVVEEAITVYPGDKNDLMAYLGPAISAEAFEVQEEILEACTADLTSAQKKIFTRKCFKPIKGKAGYFYCDIYELGRRRLQKCGVQNIYGGDFCTVNDKTKSGEARFYSHRRDSGGPNNKKKTGRMASLIWLME